MPPRFEAKFYHGEPLMIDHTPSVAIAAGQVIVTGSEMHIAHNDIAANQLGALASPGGNAVYEVRKAGGGGVVFALADTVYWDDTNKVALATGPGDGILGVAVAAAADADEVVYVRHDRGAIS